MRKVVGNIPFGKQGVFFLIQEDQWLYPQIELCTDYGEAANINLQHTSTKKLKEFATKLLEICKELEENDNN